MIAFPATAVLIGGRHPTAADAYIIPQQYVVSSINPNLIALHSARLYLAAIDFKT